MPNDRDHLTPRQRRFVTELAADGNAVQAYFRAFGRRTSKGKPRTYKSAQVSASRLLSNAILSAELEAANAEYAARVGVDKERVLRELAAIAFADPADVYRPDPENNDLPVPKPWDDIPPATRRALQSTKIKRRRLKEKGEATQWEIEEIEYKFHPKSDALDKLCRKLGLYTVEADSLGFIGELLRDAIRGDIRNGPPAGGSAEQPG